MSWSELSVKRPIFITCIVVAMLVVGFRAMKSLPVDLFPDITFPVVMVNTPYPGAGPKEMETLVSKVIEDELSNVPGIKSLKSINREGVSTVVAEFTLETDVKYAEQQIRDRAMGARRKLPADVKDSIVRRIDPADQPIVMISLKADLPPAKLFDLADLILRPKLEQISQVGLVEVLGGQKREIHVDLNQEKLKSYELSASMISQRLAATGMNIPVGKISSAEKETVFRSMGEFSSIDDLKSTVVNFLGNDVPVRLSDVAEIKDGVADRASYTKFNGDNGLFIWVFKQSGANTIAVADAVIAKVEKLNEEFKDRPEKPQLSVIRDTSKFIRLNVADVQESILIGIILTILVVYFFLGSGRSTIITGMALPNSLLGAFVLMSLAGFSINVMTLLALSLSVGLLVDDAIVVRENIFRHIERGMSPREAALLGTKEVTLAVIATTATVIAVFGPIAFLSGVVGQFFRQFGMTICFAMAISLWDALTVAPMMSAYFAGKHTGIPKTGIYGRTFGALLRLFDRFQTGMENVYVKILNVTVNIPWTVMIAAIVIFVGSLGLMKYVPKTFLSPQDFGEFAVGLDMPPGTSLDAMDKVSSDVDKKVRSHPEVKDVVQIVGNRDGQANITEMYITLVPRAQRSMNTSQFKDLIREELKEFAFASPKVKDIDMVSGGMRPFTVNIIGSDLTVVEEYSNALVAHLKDHPALKDVDTTNRQGKPEVRVVLDKTKAQRLGISTSGAGMELRNLVEGSTPVVFREEGREYNVRVALQDDQRDLQSRFEKTYVPNINYTLIRLKDVAALESTVGPATINRQDRARYVQVSADIAPDGPGMNAAIDEVKKFFSEVKPLPQGMRFAFVGQAENFQELVGSMIMAVLFAIIFIYLVLASLYESFVTPFTIMLVLPLAATGALLALFITKTALDMNSMIGCILLFGLATKNSILLVDYANQKIAEGMPRRQAILEAGKTRLRPILMTTVALIAGMLPIAIGLNEASKQRTSMGISVIGGLITSTILALVVIPAAFDLIERAKDRVKGMFAR
jgi:HAE1 family hydrophobic/amphiphilic exporter-1